MIIIILLVMVTYLFKTNASLYTDTPEKHGPNLICVTTDNNLGNCNHIKFMENARYIDIILTGI